MSCDSKKKTAISCGFLRRSAPLNAAITRNRKSAKISEKNASLAPFLPCSLSLLRLTTWGTGEHPQPKDLRALDLYVTKPVQCPQSLFRMLDKRKKTTYVAFKMKTIYGQPDMFFWHLLGCLSRQLYQTCVLSKGLKPTLLAHTP